MVVVMLAVFFIFVVFQLLYLIIPLATLRYNQVKMTKMQPQEPITLLIPAYNEARIISSCIEGIFQLDYLNYEVMIINDGSTDNTLSILNENLKLVPIIIPKANLLRHNPIINCYQSSLFPKIFVLDKINGGKSDSLNAGIEYTTNEIIITLDADCILSSQSLHPINANFKNKRIIAGGGVVQVVQGIRHDKTHPTSRFNVQGIIKYQIAQYLTDFYLHKVTKAKFNAITVLSGAFAIFRRSALNELDGFRKTIGEDMDITLRMHQLIKRKHLNKRIIFIPEATCYTECPDNFRDLFRQRFRWQKAFMDCIIKYRSSFFKDFGVGLSLYLLFDSFILGTICAFSTLIFIIILLFDSTNQFLALVLFSISILLGASQTIASLHISQQFGFSYSRIDCVRFYLFAFIETISYRLLGLVFCTLGTIMYFFNKHNWNKVKRSRRNYEVTTNLTISNNLLFISRKQRKQRYSK